MNAKLSTYLKRTISNIFYYLDRFRILKAKGKEEDKFRILLYHSVGQKEPNDVFRIRISREDFYNQMKFLKDNKFNVVKLVDIIKLVQNDSRIPINSIVITFDDGYKDNLTEAMPVLREFNFPATVFVCVDYIENNIRDSNAYWTKWEFLTPQDLHFLIDSNIDIGLHSLSHTPLVYLGREEAKDAIVNSKKKLEDYIGKKVLLFSYPHGSFNSFIIELLNVYGFMGACCSKGGLNNSKADFYKLRRTEITRFDRIFEFKKKLWGYYDILS